MDAPQPALPSRVRAFAERAVGDTPAPEYVELTQEGEMWLRPGGRAMRFRATQTIAVARVAFTWRASFPLLGPLALHVVDSFGDGEGELAVRLLGVPLQRRRGPEVTAGEALRYLAELPWTPHALLHNRALEWRDVDGARVEVATTVGGRRLAVELTFDERGDVTGSASRMRRRKVGREWIGTPWGGTFEEYETLGGARVPTVATAFWDLPGGRYVYFRGRVTTLSSS